MLSFSELVLPEALTSALRDMKYSTPTPIQEKAIPVALGNRDIIGCAQTGTGKTAAFCIPMITNLLKVGRKNGLILVPTRELALQVDEVLKQLTKHCSQINHAVLIGGAPMNPQVRALAKRPRIVVATPGRLLDHLRRGGLSLSASEILVLDEADRMLDMGFAPQLNEIYRFLPKNRQTLLFSATLPDHILKLAAKYLKDPVRVTIGAVSEPAKGVSQSMIQTNHGDKNNVLMDELNAREGSVIIFARTKRRTDRLARVLCQAGYKASRIHGDRTQKQRVDAINGFREGKFKILVATDIAARGIDISNIAHVINYDLPSVAEDYIHRIGRTARAGAKGQALSLVTPEDKIMWKDISKLVAKTKTTATPHATR